MIEVIETGSLNSVQDLGRRGQRQFGIGQSGAMDSVALAVANLLLGNDVSAAAIEIQLFPFRLRFHSTAMIAVTGADCAARIDGCVLPPWWAASIEAGQELTLEPPRNGLRSYIAISGGLDVPVVMGSRSTYFRIRVGGHEGRALQAGDRIKLGHPNIVRLRDVAGFGVTSPYAALPVPKHEFAAPDDVVLRVIPSAEYPEFSPDACRAFWKGPWRVTMHSNRMGYRLEGRPLHRIEALELRSRGIVPGVVQVPPGGQPIIQLADGNSAGGYPQIGCVIEADLWRLAQAVPGTELRFLQCGLDEARQVEADVQAYFDRLRRQASYCHAII